MKALLSSLRKLAAVAITKPPRGDVAEMATDTWDESKHPRGNPQNAGQFAKKGSGSEWIEGTASLFGAYDPWIRMWNVKSMPDEAKQWVGKHFRDMKKSPYGESFYDSDDISWDHKPDGSLRLANHWNFVSGYDQQVHCQTDKPIDNIKVWAVGRWNADKGKYEIIKQWDAKGKYIGYPEIRLGEKYPHMSVSNYQDPMLEAKKKLMKQISSNYDFKNHCFIRPVKYRFNKQTGVLKGEDD